MGDSEELLKELLETFRGEAQDHIDALGSLLVALEGEEGPAERDKLVESIFRRTHTLKGAAHAVNLLDVAKMCQDLESLFAELKRGEVELGLGLFDRLHRDIDALTERVCPVVAVQAEVLVTPTAPRPAAIISGSKGIKGNSGNHGNPGTGANAGRREGAAEKAGAQDTVRVPTRRLESLLLQAEELVSAKLTASVLAEEISAAAAELVGRDGARSRALELAGEALRNPDADLATARLAVQIQDFCEYERRAELRLRTLERKSERNLWSLGSLIDPLLEEAKNLHLLPFATLADPFSKLVRDLARELDKEAELVLSGSELEIDRRILAELKEPLLHIVRNMMDHGIEKPGERTAGGKPARGRLGISFCLKDANHALLTVSDDGRGIDPAQVKATALRLELVTPEAAQRLGDSEALQLVFESGFSTSPIISSLSGRGVGLAIVREALERLGGHVSVDSSPGQGTEFRLTLPLSYALISGVLVEAGGRSCILPAASVECTARLPRAEIRTVENRDTVVLGGELFSLVSLAGVLELPVVSPAEGDTSQQVVLLRAAERRIAFAVDQVVGVQEVLVKSLGSQLSRVRNVSGATVLGNGSVVPVLNINDLVRSALLNPARNQLSGAQAAKARPRRLSVLVAEDSITSRTLLKNILESSGYLVTTAIDGADALSQLKTGSFDIVISDVEMPRLDGFGLTAALRADGRWDALPVILVTGLESRSDRERGIEAGANAYLVKSSFDQSSLIEVIQKLT